ncbi:hypothetical protein HWV03_08555 [Moritella sp. 36]|uniref:hypothetical protein n=1 Tax=Moritella sp. 36 TaxID=2746233 RepID=UPI001BA444F9|nr:hypothetical protein [Moritella sp. 36]QUM88845.1 hypothetical protein HWV03_08555 [Moritella sp. 36]
MKRCINEYYCELDKAVEVQFQFDGINVQYISELDGKQSSSEFGYLKISIEANLKKYESLSDSAILTRSKYLIALGIVSFVIDDPLDVYDTSSSSFVFEGESSTLENKFIIDSVNNTYYLNEIIDKISGLETHERHLVFSLLDRWRKARYMEKNSESSLMFSDEATLAYFHVLELLGDLHSKELIAKSNDSVDAFVKQYNEDILSLTGQSLENENKSKLKLLSGLLSKDLSVTGKILYFLKKYDLYSNQTAFWIKNLVDARNSVAHGRRVFYDKSIFPVQPFFPLVANTMYPLEFVRVLSANVISKHLGIDLYKNEWNIIEKCLISDVQVTNEYLASGEFKKLDEIYGSEANIVNGGIDNFVLSKKISPEKCANFYKFYLKNEIENQDFLHSNIRSIIILFECVKEVEFSETLKSAIINTHRLECNIDFNFRDTMYFLDFHGFQTVKLEKLIENGAIR